MSDEQITTLFEEIRDLQKLAVENSREALKHAIELQKRAVRFARSVALAMGGLLLV